MWLIGATTGSDGNDGILFIPLSSSITGTSPLVSYQDTHRGERHTLSAEKIIAILAWNQISPNSLEINLLTNYSFQNHIWVSI